jgi:hypothetical protein
MVRPGRLLHSFRKLCCADVDGSLGAERISPVRHIARLAFRSQGGLSEDSSLHLQPAAQSGIWERKMDASRGQTRMIGKSSRSEAVDRYAGAFPKAPPDLPERSSCA